MKADISFLWCIRAGGYGEAEPIFLKHNKISIGWPAVGDLRAFAQDRSALKKRLTEVYPDRKPGAVNGDAGMLTRFAQEMKPGDLVVYPSKSDSLFHIGQITGEYEHNPSLDPEYPNLRDVKWIKQIPRTVLSQGALYEANSSLSLFQIRNYASEFLDALAGKVHPMEVPEVDGSELIAEAIEQTTKDFMRKRLAQALKGHPFQDLVADLLQSMGYRTTVCAPGADGGIDIVAHKDELGLEPPIVRVQVKSSQDTVGDPEVSSLYGKVGPNEVGLFVTLGGFSPNATKFAASKNNLRLVKGEELLDLLLLHYDELSSRYRAVIPLRKVFVPEPIDTE